MSISWRMMGAVILPFFLCASPISSPAGPVLDRVKERGILVVAMDPAWPPFSWRKSDGSFDGFDVDIMTLVARKLGVVIRFETPEFPMVVTGNWQGKWDASPSVTPTKQRAENLDFPAVYAYSVDALGVHRDNTTIRIPTDASGKRIGVVKSTEYEKYLTREAFDILDMPPINYRIDQPVIVTFDTSNETYEALAKGDGVELDGVVDSLSSLMSEISNGRPIKIIGLPLLYTPSGIAVEKGDPEFSAAIREAVDGLREDGTLKTISLKWFGIDTTTP